MKNLACILLILIVACNGGSTDYSKQIKDLTERITVLESSKDTVIVREIIKEYDSIVYRSCDEFNQEAENYPPRVKVYGDDQMYYWGWLVPKKTDTIYICEVIYDNSTFLIIQDTTGLQEYLSNYIHGFH